MLNEQYTYIVSNQDTAQAGERTQTEVKGEGQESASNDSVVVISAQGSLDSSAIAVPFEGSAVATGMWGNLEVQYDGDYSYELAYDDFSFTSDKELTDVFEFQLSDGSTSRETIRIVDIQPEPTIGWDAFINPLLDYQQRCLALRLKVADATGCQPFQVGRIQPFAHCYNARLPQGNRFVSKKEVDAM
jgi:VCBS repeat-containing protein